MTEAIETGSGSVPTPTHPILDAPTGPGWYWYLHPEQGGQKVDPVCMEVGILGTDYTVEWKGATVGLDQLPGKWQRVALSAFHGE